MITICNHFCAEYPLSIIIEGRLERFVSLCGCTPPLTFTQWNKCGCYLETKNSVLISTAHTEREEEKRAMVTWLPGHATLFYWVSLRFISRYFCCPKWYPKPPLAPTPLSLFRHLGETLLAAIGRWRGEIRQWENEWWSRPPLRNDSLRRFTLRAVIGIWQLVFTGGQMRGESLWKLHKIGAKTTRAPPLFLSAVYRTEDTTAGTMARNKRMMHL